MGGRTRSLFGFLLVLVVGAQLSFAMPAQAATEGSGITCSVFGFVLRPFGFCNNQVTQKISEVTVNNRVFDIRSVVDRGIVAGESTTTLPSPVSVTNGWGLSRSEAQNIAEEIYEKNENYLKTHSALLVALSMFTQNKALSDLQKTLSDNISKTRDDLNGRSSGGSVDLSVGGTLTSPTITDPTISGTVNLSGFTTNALLFTDSSGNISSLSSLSVDDAGNLLIGTTSVQERLTVDGPIYLGDSSPTTTTNRLYSIGGSLYWNGSIIVASSSSNWSTSGGNVYRPTGSVGIGTSSPYAELSVVGNIALTGGLYDSNATRGSNGMILQTTGTSVNWVSTSSLGLAANLSGSSIEDLGDVASMTKNPGDLLYWNGSSWADIATSTLAISTTNLIEGTNLFFTNTRVASYINSSSTLLTNNTEAALETYLSDVTNVFTNNDTIGDANIADTITASNYLALSAWYATTTSALTEGSNLYFTNARADARFNTNLNATTTSALTEGSNLYYTLARFAAALAGTTTDALAEGGTNQYFTNARVASYILGSTTISRLGQTIDESELNITGSPTDGFVLQASSTAVGGMVWVATSSLGISGSSGATTFAGLTDTPATYTTGDIFYASSSSTIARLAAGGDGTVLKISGGVPVWGADIGGSGGGGAWATSTNGLLVYPVDPNDVVVIGGSATTTTGFDLEVIGDALVTGIQASVATVTSAYITNSLDVSGHGAFGNAATVNTDRILQIDENISNNNNFFSFFNNPKVTATLTGSRSGYGSYNLFEADAVTEGANDYTAVGIYAEVQVDGSSSVGSSRAGQFVVDYNSSTGLGDNAYTLSSTLEVAGGATVNNGYGYFSDLDNQGTITNYYGIFLQDVLEGAMSNSYAFWTNQSDVVLDGDGNGLAGGTDGGTDLFFGEGQDAAIWYDGSNLNINPRVVGSGNVIVPTGRIGIGTSSPYATLSVTGDIAVTGGIYDNNATRGLSGQLLQSTATGVNWVSTSSLNISTTNLIEGTNLFFTNTRVASYINSSSTLLTNNTEAALETYLSDVTNVFTNNDTIGDANIADTITASNYLALSAWYATTTSALTEGSNLYFTNARASSTAIAVLLATTSLPNITSLASLSSIGTITSGVWQGSPIATIYGGTGTTTYTTGDLLYAASSTALTRLGIGADGTVLKVSGGVPSWGTDSTSAGSAVWSTSTNGLFVYTTDPTDIVVVGASATSTTGYKFEVNGNALVSGLFATAATTSSLTINSERFTDLTGDGLQNTANTLAVNCADLQGSGIQCVSNNLAIDFTEFDTDSITEGLTNFWGKWGESFGKLYYTPAGSDFVGIGDTDADYTFEIAGANGNGYLGISATAGGDGDILEVDSSGNIGINDNTPSFKLDLNGTFRVTGAATFDSTMVALGATFTNATATSFGLNNETFTDLTGTALINNAGVLSVSTSTLAQYFASTSAFDTSAKLAMVLTDETGSGLSVFNSSPTFSGTALFSALTASSTLTMSGNAANIALGVNNFLSADGDDEGWGLDTAGRARLYTTNGAESTMWLRNAASSNGSSMSLTFEGGSTGVDVSKIQSLLRNTTDDVDMLFHINIGNVQTEVMRISSNNALLIGTTTPNARLSVQSTGTNDIFNLFETGGAEVFTVLESGNVGIGTSSPNRLFAVNGASSFYGDINFIPGTSTKSINFTLTGSNPSGPENGIIHIDNSNNTGHALTIYSNLGASADGSLVRIRAENTTFDKPALWIENLSDSGSGSGIRLDGPRPEIEFYETDQIAPAGKFELRVNSDKFQIGTRNAGDTAFEHPFTFYRWENGGRFGIGTSSPRELLALRASTTQGTNDLFGVYDEPGTLHFLIDDSGDVVVGSSTANFNTKFDVWGNFRVGTSTTPALFVRTNDGRVGIGTDTPGRLLEIVNNEPVIGIIDSDTNALTRLSADNGTGSFNIEIDDNSTIAGSDINFQIDGTTLFTIEEGGRVGIGDPTPEQLLDIEGANAQLMLFEGDQDYIRLGIGETASTTVLGFSSQNDLLFGEYGSAGDTTIAEMMRLTKQGRLGIGTTTPSQELAVAGDVEITGRIYDNSNSPGLNGYILQSSAAGFNWVSTSSLGLGASLFSDGGSTTYINSLTDSFAVGSTTANNAKLDVWGNFRVGTSTTPALFVRTNDGRVGIGTDTPGRLLEIVNNEPVIGIIDSDTNALTRLSADNGTGSFNIEIDDNSTIAGSDINFQIDGTTLFTIEEGGRVGIGDPTPEQLLDIEGANAQLMLFEGDQDYIRLGIGETASTTVLGFSDQNALLIGSYDAASDVTLNEYARFTAAGNLGIGTTSPAQLLSVAGNAYITGALYGNNGSAGTNGMVLQSTGSGFNWVATSTLGFASTSALANYLPLTGGSLSGNLTFSGTTANIALGSNWLSGDGGDEGITVDSTGRAFINNTTSYSADDLLTLTNQGGYTAMSINSHGSVAFEASTLNFRRGRGTIASPTAVQDGDLIMQLHGSARGSSSWTNVGDFTLSVDGTPSGNNVPSRFTFFTTNASGVQNEVMRLTSQGRMGVGTSSPASLLDVWGSARFGTTSQPTLLINSSNQKIGIQNANPAVALHIGSSTVPDSTSLLRLEDANSTCNFNADTGSPSCGSDITLKKDVQIIQNELRRIVALEPSTWRWKTDSSGAPLKSGFIAQEVEKEFPDLVTESLWVDGTTRKFLNVGGLMPYVVGAVKEQQETLDELMTIGTSTQGTSSPFYKFFDNNEDTIWEKMVKIAQGFGDGILKLAGIETEILYARDITAESVTTDELCIGTTCVTESELQELLNNKNISTPKTTGTSNNNTNSNSTDESSTTTASTTTNPGSSIDQNTNTENSTTTVSTATQSNTTEDFNSETITQTSDEGGTAEQAEAPANTDAHTNETEPPIGDSVITSEI